MSVFSGPNIASSSDLVFAYDMNNTQKSWIGVPTTNIYNASYGDSGTTDGFGGGSYLDTSLQSQSPLNSTIVYARKSNAGVATWSISANLTAGVTYTYSIWCKTIAWTTIYMRRNEPGVYLQESKLASVTPGVWTRLSFTFTVSAGKSGTQVVGINVGDANPGAPNDGVFLYAAQLEQQSFMTTYVSNLRSNTQALLDLTGRNTLTASSLTYSSTGTFSFNGSNRINLTMAGSSSLNQYTRIVWVKPTASSGDMKSAMLNQIGNNSDMAVGIEAGYPAFHQYTKTTTNGTIDGDWTLRGATLTSLNTIYMIAATVDRSTSTNNISVYLNGVLDGVGSRTIGVSASDNVILGGPFTDDYAGSRMWYGDIYAAYQYNQVLTAAEIAQNFNATRSRFGL